MQTSMAVNERNYSKKRRIAAYGIAAALSEMTGADLLVSFREAEAFLRRTVEMGSVDGISHEHVARVDGFGMDTEQEIIDGLQAYIASRILAMAS